MDLFTRFNRKSVDERQIDTLIGLSKGLIADGKVNQAEAEFLLSWLIQSRQTSDNPIIINLLDKVEVMLEDKILDDKESSDLLNILRGISGETSEIGELAKTTSLPLDNPVPLILFENMSFLFTGTCVFGTRKQCHDATKLLGGKIVTSVTKSLNYLILGTYVTDSWIHENYGRKIDKAMKFRDDGVSLAIITEEHWINSGNLNRREGRGADSLIT